MQKKSLNVYRIVLKASSRSWPARRGTLVLSFGNYFGSVDKANEWKTFVVAHAETLPGYERDLAQTTESIRLCASLKAARTADLPGALQALH